MTLNQLFLLENIFCLHLHDILKRLLGKVCFDASLMCLSRFVAFRVTLTIYVVEQNVVAYANISKQRNKVCKLVQMNLYYISKLFL